MKTSLRLLLLAVFAVLFVGTASAHYNPQLGRWLSRDPMGEAGGFNLYAYCGNDPVNRHDPLGLAAMVVIRIPEAYERARMYWEWSQQTKSGLYYGTKLVKGFDNSGNPSSRWLLAQRLNGGNLNGHRYGEGKFSGTEAIWFFDNQKHALAVARNFWEYQWIVIGWHVTSVCASAGLSGLGGLGALDGEVGFIPPTGPRRPSAIIRDQPVPVTGELNAPSLPSLQNEPRVGGFIAMEDDLANLEAQLTEMLTKGRALERKLSGTSVPLTPPTPYPNTRMVPLNDLVPPPGGRMYANSERIDRIAPFDWGKYQPIVVYEQNGVIYLDNGFSRVAIAKAAGITHLPAEFLQP